MRHGDLCLQRTDRVKRGAWFSRKTRRFTLERKNSGIFDGPAASQKPTTISFVARWFNVLVITDRKVRHINRCFICRAGSTIKEQALLIRQIFTFDEHVIKCGMTLIHRLLCEDDLHVAGEGEHARLVAMICDRHAANLDIIIGRDADGCSHHNIAILALKLSAVRQERYLTSIRTSHCRLRRGGPKLSLETVLHVNPGPPIIESRIGAPTRKVKFVPAAEPGT